MPGRWFVVPVELRTEESMEAQVPKYSDTEGVVGFSGNIVDFSADIWSSLPWYPNSMYVVNFQAEDKATLDTVAANPDAFSRQEYPNIGKSDISAFLNDKLNADRTFSEWSQAFRVGDIDG